MTDAVMVFPPGFRMLDVDGNPASGWKAKFYDAGTLTPKTVYGDRQLLVGSSLGAEVTSRSDGFWAVGSTITPVFIGSGLYKLIITDENDVTKWSGDNLTGALDTSTFLTSASTSTLSIPVVATSGPTLTLGTSHRGKHVRANTASNSVTLTLDAAATLGDGWNIEVGKHAAANVLIITTTGGETINFAGAARALFALVGLGERVSIRCDGTAFYVAGYVPALFNTTGVIVIADRVTSAPVGPTGGARYIVASAYGSFATHDVIEYDGVSGYTKYTPAADCGWLAYVQDEDTYYSFQGSAWVSTKATQAEAFAGTSAVPFMTPLATRQAMPARTYAEVAANTAYTTTIPLDDTIPQSSEGSEIVTASITLSSTSSRLRVTFSGMVGDSAGSLHVILAVFQDSGTDAIFAKAMHHASATVTYPLDFVFEYSPATTSAITIKVRAGPSSAATIRFNGNSSGRYFGGVSKAALVLQEVFA